jgi:hypothetical protein
VTHDANNASDARRWNYLRFPQHLSTPLVEKERYKNDEEGSSDSVVPWDGCAHQREWARLSGEIRGRDWCHSGIERRRAGKRGRNVPNLKLNIVRGVLPGASPWRIADLRADVDTNGRIKVRGRGLLLANSNSIGQNANQRVFDAHL